MRSMECGSILQRYQFSVKADVLLVKVQFILRSWSAHILLEKWSLLIFSQLYLLSTGLASCMLLVYTLLTTRLFELVTLLPTVLWQLWVTITEA